MTSPLVGSAYVQLHALTEQLKRELRDACKEAWAESEPLAAKAGIQAGVAYSEGFKKGVSGSNLDKWIKSDAGAFNLIEREAGLSGERAGRAYASQYRSAMESTLRDVNPGDAFSSSYSDASAAAKDAILQQQRLRSEMEASARAAESARQRQVPTAGNRIEQLQSGMQAADRIRDAISEAIEEGFENARGASGAAAVDAAGEFISTFKEEIAEANLGAWFAEHLSESLLPVSGDMGNAAGQRYASQFGEAVRAGTADILRDMERSARNTGRAAPRTARTPRTPRAGDVRAATGAAEGVTKAPLDLDAHLPSLEAGFVDLDNQMGVTVNSTAELYRTLLETESGVRLLRTAFGGINPEMQRLVALFERSRVGNLPTSGRLPTIRALPAGASAQRDLSELNEEAESTSNEMLDLFRSLRRTEDGVRSLYGALRGVDPEMQRLVNMFRAAGGGNIPGTDLVHLPNRGWEWGQRSGPGRPGPQGPLFSEQLALPPGSIPRPPPPAVPNLPSLFDGFNESTLGQIQSGLTGLLGVLKSVATASAVALVPLQVFSASGTITAIIGDLAHMAGTLATIPAIATSVGAAMAAIKIGTDGVKDTISAFIEANKNSAESSYNYNQQLKESYHDVAEAAHNQADAVHNVAESEYNETIAVRNARQATLDLIEARRDMMFQLEDLNLQLRGSQLSVQRANLEVVRAYREMRTAQFDPTKTLWDKDEAVQNYEEAIQQADEAKQHSIELTDEVQRANRKGVEGSKQVIDAKNAQQSALHQVGQSQYEVTQSQYALTQAIYASTQAQQKLSHELEIGNPAYRTANLELSRLSPNAQAFVKTVLGLTGAWHDLNRTVSTNLFDGAAASMQILANAQIPVLKQGLGGIATALNGIAIDIATAFSTPETMKVWSSILEEIQEMFITLRPGIDGLVDAFKTLTTVGSTFLPRLGSALADVFLKFDSFIDRTADTGQLTHYIQQSIDALKIFGSILGNIAGIIHAVFGAGAQEGQTLLQRFDDLTGRADRFLHSFQGQNDLKNFFLDARQAGEAMRPVWDALGDDLKIIGPELIALGKADSGGVVSLLKGVGEGLTYLKPVVGEIGSTMAAIDSVGGTVIAQLGRIAAVVVSVVQPAIAPLRDGLKEIAVAFGDLAARYGPQVGQQFAQLARLIKPLADVIASVINSLSPVLLPLATVILPPIVDAFRTMLDVVKPLVPLIIGLAGAYTLLRAAVLAPGFIAGVFDRASDSVRGLSATMDSVFTGRSLQDRARGWIAPLQTSTDNLRQSVGDLGDRVGAVGTRMATTARAQVQGMATAMTAAEGEGRTLAATLSGAVSSSVSGLRTAAGGLINVLGGLPGIATLAVGALLTGFDEAVRNAKGTIDAYQKSVEQTTTDQDDLTKALQNTGGSVNSSVMDSITRSLKDYSDTQQSLADKSPGMWASIFTPFSQSTIEAGGIVDQAKQTSTAIANIGLTNQQLSTALTGSQAGFDTIISKLFSAGQGGTNFANELIGLRETILNNENPTDQIATAYKTLGDNATSATDAISGMNTAMNNLYNQQFAFQDAQAKMSTALDSTVSGITAQTGAMIEADGTIDTSIPKSGDFYNTIRQLQQAFDDATAAAKRNAQEHGANADQQQQAADRVATDWENSMRRQFIAAGIPQKAVDALLAKYKLTAQDWKASFDIDTTPATTKLSALDQFIQKAQAHPITIPLGFSVPSAVAFGGASAGAAAAAAGPGFSVSPQNMATLLGIPGAPPSQHAEGGRLPVVGPGTGKRDGFWGFVGGGALPSVKLNGGEWIVNATSSAKYNGEIGAMNAGTFPRIPGYADGGIINSVGGLSSILGASAGATSGGTNFSGDSGGNSVSGLLSSAGQSLNNLGAAFQNAWKTTLGPGWVTVGQGIVETKLKMIDPAFSDINQNVIGIGTNINTASTKTILPAWQAMAEGLSSTQKDAINPAFKGIQEGLTITTQAFTQGASDIGTQWTAIEQKTAAPVKWTIDNVFNNGIVGMWNSVSQLLGTTPMKPYVAQFATGGLVTGGISGKDSVPSLLTPDEFVLNTGAVKRAGLANLIRFNNGSMPAEGLFMGFAEGGAVPKPGSPAWNKIRDAQAFALSMVGTPYLLGGDSKAGIDCCLVGDTMVYGPDGAKPIDELCAGDRVYSYVDDVLTTQTVTAQWQSETQQVFRVRTRNRSITGSANHPFMRLVQTKLSHRIYSAGCGAVDPAQYGVEWVRLDELRRGDLLIQPRSMETEEKPHPTFSDGTSINLNQAWLMGLILRSGSVGDKGIQLGVFGETRDRAAEQFRAWGVNPWYGPSNGVTASSQRLAEEYARFGLRKKAFEKRMPEAVWNWPHDLQRAFLNGYADADGHYPQNKRKYGERSYASCSRRLLEDVRALHIMLGDPVSNITTTERTKPIVIKGKTVKNARPLHAFTVYARGKDGTVALTHHNKDLAAWMSYGDFIVTRVLNIEDKGIQETYDIEVAGAHNFVAEGVVVHNSGFVSAVANVINGQSPFSSRWSTDSNGRFQQGFIPGLSAGFSIGVHQGGAGGGHTAGTLGGIPGLPTLNVESAGGIGVRVGANAWGADQPYFTEHDHLPIVNGSFVSGGLGGGPGSTVGGFIHALVDPAAASIQQAVASTSFPGVIGQLPGQIANTLINTTENAINGAAGKLDALAGASGGGAARWTPLVVEALKLTGQSLDNVQRTIQQIQIESGGDPTAVNLSDSNAKAGHPSRGLLQDIPSTFEAWRLSSLPDDVNNPLANIVASIRYAVNRYHSLASIWPTTAGYDSGGKIMPGLNSVYNGLDTPEALLSPDQWQQATQAIGLASSIAKMPKVSNISDALNAPAAQIGSAADDANVPGAQMYTPLAGSTLSSLNGGVDTNPLSAGNILQQLGLGSPNSVPGVTSNLGGGNFLVGLGNAFSTGAYSGLPGAPTAGTYGTSPAENALQNTLAQSAGGGKATPATAAGDNYGNPSGGLPAGLSLPGTTPQSAMAATGLGGIQLWQGLGGQIAQDFVTSMVGQLLEPVGLQGWAKNIVGLGTLGVEGASSALSIVGNQLSGPTGGGLKDISSNVSEESPMSQYVSRAQGAGYEPNKIADTLIMNGIDPIKALQEIERHMQSQYMSRYRG